MKISLEVLNKDRPEIQALVINSFECEIYLVEVKIDSQLFKVVGLEGKPLVFRSQLAAKMPFKGMEVQSTILRQTSAYSEMIGLESGVIPPLEVRLSNPDDDLS